MQVRFRNFNVVAENLVEANFQRADARALALALFHGGDDLFAVLAQVAQLVEFSVIAGANDAGISGESGRFVGDGALKAFADIGEFINFFVEATKKFAATDGRGRHKILQDRELAERFAQSDEFARSGQAQGDAAGEAFEVEDTAEFLANLSANNCLLNEVSDGGEARVDGVAIDERTKKPGAQEARAHPRHGDVQGGDQRGGSRGAAGFLGKNGREQLEIADGNGIENERVVVLVVADAIQVPEGFDAGRVDFLSSFAGAIAAGGVFTQVMDDGAGGAKSLRMIVQTEAREFRDAELFAKDALSVVALKGPVF